MKDSKVAIQTCDVPPEDIHTISGDDDRRMIYIHRGSKLKRGDIVALVKVTGVSSQST